ncbi:hypothetical protein C8R48DRAFT_772600 [Suillus tomentosus]|nr:hypothetical protein C8R48DRAFT_772600 [Suillus tomentosus]
MSCKQYSPGVEDKQLTAEDIKRGLGLTAKHLKSKKKQITVVAVGGAINTILLRSRASTADVWVSPFTILLAIALVSTPTTFEVPLSSEAYSHHRWSTAERSIDESKFHS